MLLTFGLNCISYWKNYILVIWKIFLNNTLRTLTDSNLNICVLLIDWVKLIGNPCKEKTKNNTCYKINEFSDLWVFFKVTVHVFWLSFVIL